MKREREQYFVVLQRKSQSFNIQSIEFPYIYMERSTIYGLNFNDDFFYQFGADLIQRKYRNRLRNDKLNQSVGEFNILDFYVLM